MRNNPRALPSREKLHELFAYEPETGFLVNKGTAYRKKGALSGTLDTYGYGQVCIEGKLFRSHRVVWKMAHGVEPLGLDVDHINGDKSDNRLENLQLLSHRANCSREKTTKSGLPAGVGKTPENRYRASIRLGSEYPHIGNYDTPEEASQAYEKALEMYSSGATTEEIRRFFGVGEYKSRGTSSIKGVSWDKNRGKWLAKAVVDNKRRYLGRFLTEEEAIEAVRRAK